ncbi:MAG TPA: hydrogenase iron-sulfur subunit [Armatimonadota bacterium]|nr:hydrogenase iron-sulfur subunit [Armatimonadota bacterium]
MTVEAVQAQHEDKRPKIVAFLCNWCSYAGADLAGSGRMDYPANLRVIRVPCSGRVDPLFVLKALEQGADAVLVSGCHPGDCHYAKGNYYARRRLTALLELLEFTGVPPHKYRFEWVSASEGKEFAQVIREMVEALNAAEQKAAMAHV